MNKSISPVRMITVGLLLTMVTIFPLAVQAMDTDELIAKSIEASGGLEKLQAVKSAKFTGKFLAQGMEFPFTMTQKRPGMMRIDANIMGSTMVQCFAGDKGWTINPMTGSTAAQPMSEMEEMSFRLQADMDGILVAHAKKGYTVEYIGEEDVEGTSTYHLKVDTNTGIVLNMYMDTEYLLNIKTSSKMTMDENEYETQTYMSDFQEIDGLTLPFAIETRSGDAVMNQIMMETVEYGIEVDDSLFEMPETPSAPETPELGK